jgi:ornithine--oxo-acid transaminase
MQWLTPGSHGSTFGGNPLAAAIGKRALELLEEENLIENSRILGEYFKNELINMKSETILDVRGKGLWIGVQMNPNFISGKELSNLLLKKGILAKETHETVIRFAPPLVISKQEIDWALDTIKEILQDTSS